MRSEPAASDRKPWSRLLTEADRQVIANAGYGQSRGMGANWALVVIDCQRIYIGDDAPVELQQSRWPAGGGENAWRAVENIRALIDEARASDIPVIYTRNVQKHTLKFDGFARKSSWNHSASIDGTTATEIVEELTPTPGDLVLDKSYASAFHGTPLTSWLTGLQVDSLVVVGVSTSGCVRATSVDAVSHGYNVTVVQDAVADRITVSHDVALLDLWMKYTDLMATAQVLTAMRDKSSRAEHQQ